jgi:5'-phosphate synthase pdxT subunit
MVKIGILGLQGGVSEHARALELCGATVRVVKSPGDLSNLDGLILPGGESTTISRLVRLAGLETPLKDLIGRGLPVWGTCAGAILLCTDGIFASLEAEIVRNAYGPQLHSLLARGTFMDRMIPMVFIRAPRIISASTGTSILGRRDADIVAIRKGHLLATTFHPELSHDLTVTRYFLDMALEGLCF